ncbi:MAG: Asp-tRNA(Asn)/Glu-tRNA(Gln) amidotransferase subunit GatC [Pirellulales bacterium]
MSLDRAAVEKIALLSRLRLSADELTVITPKLQQILGYIDQLNELDTAGVPPMAHGVELTNVLAADVERPGLDREAALANAPKRDDACFRVPAVLGD